MVQTVSRMLGIIRISYMRGVYRLDLRTLLAHWRSVHCFCCEGLVSSKLPIPRGIFPMPCQTPRKCHHTNATERRARTDPPS